MYGRCCSPFQRGQGLYLGSTCHVERDGCDGGRKLEGQLTEVEIYIGGARVLVQLPDSKVKQSHDRTTRLHKRSPEASSTRQTHRGRAFM